MDTITITPAQAKHLLGLLHRDSGPSARALRPQLMPIAAKLKPSPNID